MFRWLGAIFIDGCMYFFLFLFAVYSCMSVYSVRYIKAPPLCLPWPVVPDEHLRFSSTHAQHNQYYKSSWSELVTLNALYVLIAHAYTLYTIYVNVVWCCLLSLLCQLCGGSVRERIRLWIIERSLCVCKRHNANDANMCIRQLHH